jgi:hypothetical protein
VQPAERFFWFSASSRKPLMGSVMAEVSGASASSLGVHADIVWLTTSLRGVRSIFPFAVRCAMVRATKVPVGRKLTVLTVLGVGVVVACSSTRSEERTR